MIAWMVEAPDAQRMDRDEMGHYQVVVHADTKKEAKQIARCHGFLNEYKASELEASRLPELDAHPINDYTLWRYGGWFAFCRYCQREIQSDEPYDYEADEPLDPCEAHGYVFCSSSCRDAQVNLWENTCRVNYASWEGIYTSRLYAQPLWSQDIVAFRDYCEEQWRSHAADPAVADELRRVTIPSRGLKLYLRANGFHVWWQGRAEHGYHVVKVGSFYAKGEPVEVTLHRWLQEFTDARRKWLTEARSQWSWKVGNADVGYHIVTAPSRTEARAKFAGSDRGDIENWLSIEATRTPKYDWLPDREANQKWNADMRAKFGPAWEG